MKKNDFYFYDRKKELWGLPGYRSYASLDDVVELLQKTGNVLDITVTEYRTEEEGDDRVIRAQKAIIRYEKLKVPKKLKDDY